MEESENAAGAYEDATVEELLKVIIAHLEVSNITNMRLYDVMAAGLASTATGEAIWQDLDAKHAKGGLHNGFPFMREDPWSDD